MNQAITKNLLIVDIETSGVNPVIHDPLAVAFVPLMKNVAPLEIYVRPPSVSWSDHARANFLRYAEDWQNEALPPAEVCWSIDTYLYSVFGGEQATLVGHNVGFDMAFLAKLAALAGQEGFAGLSHRSVDTHTLLFLLCLMGDIPSSALTSDGAFDYFGIHVPDEIRHTALGDAVATSKLLLNLLPLVSDRSITLDSSPVHQQLPPIPSRRRSRG